MHEYATYTTFENIDAAVQAIKNVKHRDTEKIFRLQDKAKKKFSKAEKRIVF